MLADEDSLPTSCREAGLDVVHLGTCFTADAIRELDRRPSLTAGRAA